MVPFESLVPDEETSTLEMNMCTKDGLFFEASPGADDLAKFSQAVIYKESTDGN